MPEQAQKSLVSLLIPEYTKPIVENTNQLKKGDRKMGMEKYRIDQSKGLEFGLYSLGDHLSNPQTGERISAQQRLKELVETAKLADQAGIDFLVLVKAIKNILLRKHTQLY